MCFGDGTGSLPSSSDVSAETNASSEVALGRATSGTTIIIKDPVPDSGSDFAFTTTGILAPTSFSLDDNAYGTLANTRTFIALTAGSYTVTEAAAAGCSTTVACVDPDGGSSTVGTNIATIDADASETITCTHTNT